MDIIVSVSDKYLWALKPFCYLFNKYWDNRQKVFIIGYKKPDFVLPDNFIFYSIAYEQYQKNRWADGIISFLNLQTFKTFVLFLEDYWICRYVDVRGVMLLNDFISSRDDILRIDLTSDRLYASGCRDVGYYNRFDIIEAPQSEYQMSLQCGIWNREIFLSVLSKLNDDRSPWNIELSGTTIVNSHGYIVYGTRQYPVRYVNAMNNSTQDKINLIGLNIHDIDMVKSLLGEGFNGRYNA
ncbi:MAG: hypothetical protein HPY87_08940 [Fervidobacterium sp.]|uniref:hypothetical protein n=1 Tax=Fervidobacterium sp. TaxID=1871331 RepID=UPI0025C30E0D|nr:hypothetical protein [Fervidobacterium sp.]NPU89986.1 hypothetical protein [Fervidobacterium sp.]